MKSNWNFFIIATTCPTAVGQQELVCSLQSAYNQGAAGQFKVVPHAGGFVVVFDRTTRDDDHEYILKRRLTAPLSTTDAALEQLRAEIQESMPAGQAKDLLTKGQWTVVDFNGALDEIEEIASNMLPTKVAPGTFWVTQAGDIAHVIEAESAGDARFWVRHPNGDKRLCNANGVPMGVLTEASRKAWALVQPLGLHTALAGFHSTWLTPVRNDQDAEAFLLALKSSGQLFHPDDDPGSVIGVAGKPVFSKVEADVVRLRMAEVHFYHPNPSAFALQLTSQ